MSRRTRKGHGAAHAEHENSERWLLTYADMITLLLALFIVLFAVSSINSKKFLALALGLKQSFNPSPNVLVGGSGVLSQSSLTKTAGDHQMSLKPSSSTMSPGGTPSTTTTTSPAEGALMQSEQQLAQLQKEIEKALAQKGLQKSVTTTVEQRGLVVQVLTDKVFFASDEADLESGGQRIVDTMAGILETVPNDVIVEGYTDNAPIVSGPYASNMELSAMRAVNVVQRLTQVDGIDPSRLSAEGYGETHPAVPN
ncbi:MAG TPA: flagellar motor protein MotB, partial [Acidimicrobiales bacterium]|nr:flagellar motor protein MotB [Acidimicrobiales bacterium]